MKDKVRKIDDFLYRLEPFDNMTVPAEFFLNELLFEKLEDKAVEQLKNVASLPGIYKKAIAMPDCHIGYGFPIGGVAAIDRENGCISPGGIGFDINCGVRMLATTLTRDDVEPNIKELLDSLFRNVPSGVGSESSIRLDDKQLNDVLTFGTRWALDNGYGVEEDIIMCEEEGRMKSADANKVSPRAKARGKKQLGSLGAGNHFLEIQVVEEIHDPKIAKVFGITQKGQIVVMIHSGSRGLGHQVCSDYLRKMEDTYPDIMQKLPEKDLIYAPAGSKLARDYFAAMSAAANFAWTNRHIMAHQVRKAFTEFFPEAKISTIYDVAHNIAKEEEHEIDGVKRKVWTHRKGATRAFGPQSPHIPKDYLDVGQPIILPGSMGTGSYLLVGSQTAEEQTFGSTAHGAGRVMSRMAAKKQFRADEISQELERKQIYVKAASRKGICEEAPLVYKDIDQVVKVSHAAGIGNIVAKVRPFGVVKG
ncbi:MAG: RtcB family protein [Candidatus Woesearchaeota archaeon]